MKAAAKPAISFGQIYDHKRILTDDDEEGTSTSQACSRTLIRDLRDVFIDPRVSDDEQDCHSRHQPKGHSLDRCQDPHEHERGEEHELPLDLASNCYFQSRLTVTTVIPYGLPEPLPGAPMYQMTIPTINPRIVPA